MTMKLKPAGKTKTNVSLPADHLPSARVHEIEEHACDESESIAEAVAELAVPDRGVGPGKPKDLGPPSGEGHPQHPVYPYETEAPPMQEYRSPMKLKK